VRLTETLYRVRCSLGPVPAQLLAVDEVLRGPDVHLLKDDARTTVAVLAVGGTELVLKRFREGSLVRVLEVLALGSGAARVWQGATRMRAAGFPVPEIIAVLERPRLGVPTRSCAVARRVPGMPLDELWRVRHGAARRALAVAFADYLRRLHQAGLYPQDLRGANVLVSSETPAAFVLVDLDRVRRYRRVSWRRRRKNLVQVHRSVGRNAARSYGLRFLRRYLGNASHDELGRAALEILRLGKVKDAEYLRRRTAAAARASEGCG
jgi:hypothetical protein